MIREIMTCFIEQLLSIAKFSIILFLTNVREEKKEKQFGTNPAKNFAERMYYLFYMSYPTLYVTWEIKKYLAFNKHGTNNCNIFFSILYVST